MRLASFCSAKKLLPYSTLKFLLISKNWSTGSFHRNAPHVLQAQVIGAPGEAGEKNLAFQEYNADFPHEKKTLGFAGRPSGPAFYISMGDNSRNHGPGPQQKQNPHEADANFGTVVEGWEDVIIARMKTQPGAQGGNSFVSDSKNHIIISALRVTDY